MIGSGGLMTSTTSKSDTPSPLVSPWISQTGPPSEIFSKRSSPAVPLNAALPMNAALPINVKASFELFAFDALPCQSTSSCGVRAHIDPADPDRVQRVSRHCYAPVPVGTAPLLLSEIAAARPLRTIWRGDSTDR